MTDLSTSYLGLTLRNPVVASASPLSQDADGVRRLADAGVGAVVLASLMEERVREQEVEDFLDTAVHEDTFGEALTYFPEQALGRSDGVTRYLEVVERASAAVDVPVIASLNGATTGGWTQIAERLEAAGAAAIELNVYAVPGDIGQPGARVEEQHVEIVQAVRQAVSVPVAVKLSPFFSNTGAMAAALVGAGADGLVLFNRFLQPDIDTYTVSTQPSTYLSRPEDGRLPRTWIAMLRHRLPQTSFALTTGVWSADDVVKALLAGADVVMTASALLEEGLHVVDELLEGTRAWMSAKGALELSDLRGLLAVPVDVDAGGRARSGYVSALDLARSSWAGVGPVGG
jgi:dihydroorotate dehydrogenase (fumarate)